MLTECFTVPSRTVRTYDGQVHGVRREFQGVERRRGYVRKMQGACRGRAPAGGSGADMPSLRRKYCSDSCRKKGERIKAGKAAVKTDSFAEYEKACVEAMKRGEWLTYGRFMAQKMTEGA